MHFQLRHILYVTDIKMNLIMYSNVISLLLFMILHQINFHQWIKY